MPGKNKFEKLGLFYILALSGIALSIVISQFLVQNYIGKQQDDSRVINVAGRQRMLSQKISKLALQVGSTDSAELRQKAEELKVTLRLWTTSHQGLQKGNQELGLKGENSKEVKTMYQSIEPHYQAMVTNTEKLIRHVQTGVQTDQVLISECIRAILSHEGRFLTGMDRIVFQYDDEARHKVTLLSRTEIVLLVVSLAIILLELIFIFRPLARSVRKTVAELVESEGSSKKMAGEMSKLYEALVKSYQDLEAVNIKPPAPRALVDIDFKGNVIKVSRLLNEIMGYDPGSAPNNFLDLLLDSGYSKDFVKGMIKMVANGQKWTGEIRLVNSEGDFCWLEIFVVPVSLGKGKNSHVKIIARDITEMKEAKMRSREINREKIEKRVREQQYRSVLILEGQEEERKRLSRELHDGIGQMLTALKLSLESITPSSSTHTKNRLEETRELMKKILREVRRVSFNLTPSSLSDFGIVPAVKQFCKEVSELSTTQVVFENKTRFINRLENHVENNLYRIVQEAVNNAIKYARANTIRVTFEHNTNSLNILIEDDGKGFDHEKLKRNGYFRQAGHGIFNMKERAAFINGSFDLKTKPNQGTKVSINLPLD